MKQQKGFYQKYNFEKYDILKGTLYFSFLTNIIKYTFLLIKHSEDGIFLHYYFKCIILTSIISLGKKVPQNKNATFDAVAKYSFQWPETTFSNQTTLNVFSYLQNVSYFSLFHEITIILRVKDNIDWFMTVFIYIYTYFPHLMP